jgi:hypothetical protein
VAVRKKFLFANPCAGVEFPPGVEGLFLLHYVTWSEQQKVEFRAPDYLRNVIRIITETGQPKTVTGHRVRAFPETCQPAV